MFIMALLQMVHIKHPLVQEIQEVTAQQAVDQIHHSIYNIRPEYLLLFKTHTQLEFIRFICSLVKWDIPLEWRHKQ